MPPIFDIDDLYFLNWSGLALRHVELSLGKKEMKEGSTRGDAVSLANFGRSDTQSTIEHTQAFCIEFQKKLEAFIFHSFRLYHSANNHYQDAAFMLIHRGDDARVPYDFDAYPLGKCGSLGFSKQAVCALFSSEYYDNEDIEHAVLNTLIDLKASIKALKLAHIEIVKSTLQQQGKVASQRLQELLVKIQNLFEKDVYMPIPILPLLDIKSIDDQKLNYIHQLLDNLALIKKEDVLYTLKIESYDIELLSEEAVYPLLFKFIENQNLPKVRLCLEKLPKGGTHFDMSLPLQKAAIFASTDILKAIYEHTPQSLRTRADPSPLFSAIYNGHLANVHYLLSLNNQRHEIFILKH